MEQLVKVVRREPDGNARVALVRQSACSGDCHKCSGCGTQEQTVFVTARNLIDAPVGALVVLHSETAPVLAAAAVLYMVPLALFFLGYFLGAAAWQRGGLCGVLAFGLGVAGAVAYDRLVMKKKETVYTITGYGHQPES